MQQDDPLGSTTPPTVGGSADDGAPSLIVVVRYADLVAAGIVSNWTQLLRLIEFEGFPVGFMLAPNTRAWRLDDVNAWITTRPAPRDLMPSLLKPRGRPRKKRTKEDPSNSKS
jgi:hypothetical protein